MPVLPSHSPLSFEAAEREPVPHAKYWYQLVVVLIFFLIAAFMIIWLGLIFDSSLRRRLILTWTHSVLSIENVGNEMEVGPVWYGLKGGEHCLRYATREYTAKLVGDPAGTGQDMMKLCRDMPTEIHGRTLFTDFCQDLGFGRGVWGFWIVNFEETDCETKWGDFVDLGCAGSTLDDGQINPIRRIESHLENLQEGSSWQIMCVTTPADIDGRHFGSPDDCRYSPFSGTYGVWDVTDSSCRVD